MYWLNHLQKILVCHTLTKENIISATALPTKSLDKSCKTLMPGAWKEVLIMVAKHLYSDSSFPRLVLQGLLGLCSGTVVIFVFVR